MNYPRELSLRKDGGKDTDVKELLAKKTAHSLILGKSLDKQVQEYLRSLCSKLINGVVINSAITIACAKSIVKNYNSNLLECNSDHISLTKN